MDQLKGRILETDALADYQKNQLFELMSMYFDGMVRDNFDKDLEDKSLVIILEDSHGKIQGFSTIMLLDEIVEGIPIKAVFSGDTIIHKNYWGERELMRTFGQFILSLIQRYPQTKLYWFLISMGYKTYRFLPVFFKEFYPRYNKPTPEFEKRVLDALGHKKYPLEYDSQTGVIHFTKPKEYLKPGVADITDERLKNPHIRFFLHQNPLYIKGDELACLTELSKGNLKSTAYRVITLQKKEGTK